jgi:hypothetical protein
MMSGMTRLPDSSQTSLKVRKVPTIGIGGSLATPPTGSPEAVARPPDRDLVQLFGHELYYSIAWQLMSNRDFHDFAKKHHEDRAIWERTIEVADVRKSGRYWLNLLTPRP